ncbi:MAG: PAS domain S-box protein [Methanobacterium sp.]
MQKEKILVVEDEGLTALNIKSLLEKWGYEVPAVALSSTDAIENAAKFNFNLVLVDINLKENIDGIEVADKLKKEYNVPIVYLTAHSDKDTLDRVKLTEPFGYMVKPFNNQELKITLETALFRHRLENKLSESRMKFKSIFKNTSVGMMLVDTNGYFISVNESKARFLGYDVKELVGKPFSDFIHPDDNKKDSNLFKSILNGEIDSFDVENRFIRKDGRIVWSRLHVSANKNRDKSIKNIIVVSEDITKQKNAEEKYRQIVETANEGILSINADEIITFINKKMTDLLGYKAEEMIGKPIKTFISKNRLSNHDEHMKNRRKGISERYEQILIHKNGKEIFTLISSTALMNGNGKYNGSFAMFTDITERKKAEKLLKSANIYNRGLIESNLDPLVTIGPDGKITDVNSSTEAITGYSRDQLIGTDFSNYFTHPKKAKDGYMRVFKEKTVKNYELEIKHKNGSITLVSYNASVYTDKKGNVIGVFAAARDISQSKKTEQYLEKYRRNLENEIKKQTNKLEEAYNALKESEEKFRLIFDKAQDSIVLNKMANELPGNIIEANEATIKRLGYTKDELLKMKPSDIIAPEELPKMPKNAEKLKKEGHAIYETIHVTKDGRRIPVEVNNHIIEFKGEKIALTIVRDITERKQAEKEIKANLKHLDILNKVILTANNSDTLKSLLINVLNLVLELMSFDGGGIYLIDNGIAHVKYSSGLPQEFINSVNKLKINEPPFNKVLVKGEVLFTNKYDTDHHAFSKWKIKSVISIPIYSKDKIIGAFNIASKNRYYFNENEEQTLITIGQEIGNAISKLIAEKEMKKLIEELKRSSDELQQFAYVTSHDLQEPLRTIASFTQLLERRYKGQFDEDADEFVDYVVNASIQMKMMIRDLREYIEVTRFECNAEYLDSEDAFNNALDDLTFNNENVKIKVDKLPHVIADKKLLIIVFTKLIENAFKFKKESQVLKIHISVAEDKKNGEYIFSISDNGIGIEEQYFDRIFTIFQKLHLKEEYPGTGIGLSIAKRIIERHGGRMWVESIFGKGSIFYFTLKMP